MSAYEIIATTEKRITRRGVIWLGQTCNQRCEFCYFTDRVNFSDHPEWAFMGIDKAKAICRTLVDFYGNNAVDLQGGEPTIYPGILELVAYCREIGLAPTLITNGQSLADRDVCDRFRTSGINDFLVSIQGIGEVHDRLVGVRGAHKRQLEALHNLVGLSVPFRFNTVMSKPTIAQLPDIALLAVEVGAYVVNFITYNPFGDQAVQGKRVAENVPRYSDVRPKLEEALDILSRAGIEANVRYFPLCMVEEPYRKSVYNFQQLSYDPHEWDFASWGWTGLVHQRTKEGHLSPPILPSTNRLIYHFKDIVKRIAAKPLIAPLLYSGYRMLSSPLADMADKEKRFRKIARLHAQEHCHYIYGDDCRKCNLQDICDGFHGDYARIFGTMETRPVIDGAMVADPCHYIRHQKKVHCNPEKE